MKKTCLLFTLALLLFCTPALADVAGALTETELGTWLNRLILTTDGEEPLNAPVGEEALTDDGYAFLYDCATLYYGKPVLDGQSVLNAVSVTDEALDMPRNVRLGAPAEMLLTAYGWQNPTLEGDDTFAPLYVLDLLPGSAYWALAQRSGNTLQSVQCAVHALAGEDRYTDAGILYTVLNGEVSAIRVYGLNAYVTRADVESNLTAVGGAAQAETKATLVSDAEPFGADDLQFGTVDFLTFTKEDAAAVFGECTGESWVEDDDGGWMQTLGFAGASLVYGTDAQKQNARLESLTMTDAAVSGPRGITVGMSLADVLALFRRYDTGDADASVSVLYGDGQTPPYGALETDGPNATLRYAAVVTDTDGATLRAALYLTFTDETLEEISVYTL